MGRKNESRPVIDKSIVASKMLHRLGFVPKMLNMIQVYKHVQISLLLLLSYIISSLFFYFNTSPYLVLKTNLLSTLTRNS